MALELPRYSKCCFCIPLRIGVLLIGYVSLFASCFTLATVSWSIYKVSEYVRESQLKPTPGHSPDDVWKTSLGLYISFGYYLLVFLLNFVLSLLLIIGAHGDKPKLLRLYFKATLFLFALSLILVVVTCVFMGFLATVPILKWSFTLLVCMIIVRSHYLVLEESVKPPLYELQPYVPVPQQAPSMT